MLYFLFEALTSHLDASYAITRKTWINSPVLSKIFRVIRKVIAEVFGALVISVGALGMFMTGFLCEGIMRVVWPVVIFIAILVIYGFTWFISDKKDRR